MSIRVIRSERNQSIYVTVISDETKLFDSREFDFKPWVGEDDKISASELKALTEDKRAKVEKELDEWISEFKARDQDIASLYNVKMKSFKVSFDEVSHFSASEVKALENKIDMNEVRELAKSLGINTKSPEDTDGNMLESEYDRDKRIISEILKKEPDFDFGFFLFKSVEKAASKIMWANTVKVRDGFSMKIKNELKESIVAIDAFNERNVLFTDGSFTGKPFTNKKVEKFLEDLSEGLRTGNLEECMALREKLTKFTKVLESGYVSRFMNKRWDNPLFAGRFESNPKSDAVTSLFDEEDFDAKLETLRSYISDVLPYERKDSVFWQEKNITGESVKAEVIGKIEAYLSVLSQYADDSVPSLRAALDSLFAQIDDSKKLFVEMKPWVLERLKEEKKPVTLKRIQKKMSEFNAAYEGKNHFLVNANGDDRRVQALFHKELAESEEKENAKALKKEESAFKAKRIKKGTRASDALLEHWESLSDEDKAYLIELSVSDEKGTENISYFFSSGAAHNIQILATALRLQGKKITSHRDLLKSQRRDAGQASYILRALIELGAPIDKLPWEDLSGVNVVELMPFVPLKHLPKAIELLATRARNGSEIALLSEALGKMDGKLSSDTIEILFNALSTLMRLGDIAFPLIEEHGERLLAQDKRFFNLLAVCAIKNPLSKIVLDPMVALSKSEPSLSFFLFSWANKQGDKGLANAFLKNALEAEDWEKDVSSFLSIGSHGTMTKPSELLSASNVAGDSVYSDTLISAIQRTKYCYLGQKRRMSSSRDLSLETMKKIFAGSSLSPSDQEEMVKEMFGLDSDENFEYHEHKMGADVEQNIIDMLLKSVDDAREADAKAREDRYAYRQSSRYSQADRAARLSQRHMPFFDKLMALDQSFARLENIENAPMSVLKALSTNNQALCSMLCNEAFKEYVNHNHHDKLEHYLSIFSENPSLSKRIILRADMKPLQAVVVARVLERSAVEENSFRLLAAVESSEKALEALMKIVKLEMDDKLSAKMASRPNGIVARVVGGELSLSEKDWNTLFSSSEHIEEVFVKLFDEQKTLKKILALAETFDCDIERAVSYGFSKIRGNLSREKTLTEDLASLKALGLKNLDLASKAVIESFSKDMSIQTLEESISLAAEMKLDISDALSELVDDCLRSVRYESEKDSNEFELLKHLALKGTGVKAMVLNSIAESTWLNEKKSLNIFEKLGWLEEGQEILLQKKKDDENENDDDI